MEGLYSSNINLDKTFLEKYEKNIKNINDDINNYKTEIEDNEGCFTFEEAIINEVIDKINKLGKFTKGKNMLYNIPVEDRK